MSDDKKKSLQLFKKEKKKLDISAQAIVDNIVFNKTNAVAYYKVSPQMFDFLSTRVQISNAAKVSAAFNALLEDKSEPLELHTITTSSPINIEAWMTQVDSIVSDWNGGSAAFDDYLNKMADHLLLQDYSQRIAYIGIDLGTRGAINFSEMNPLEAGVKGAFETFKEWASKITTTYTDEISASEEAMFRSREQRFASILKAGALRAEPVTAEEILLVLKRTLYPTMPAPYLDVDHENRIGAGDIALESAAGIREKYRHLEINQLINNIEITGYRATMTLTKFPKKKIYPITAIPFFYVPQKLMGLPFTTFSRVKLIPNAQMRKEVEKKRKEKADQLKNMNASAQSQVDATVEDTSQVEEELQSLRDIDSMTNADKNPWVEGTYRIVVEATSDKALRDISQAIKQKYAESDIKATISAGDQLDLLLEQMPGDKMRSKSFKQLTNLHQLSTSGFNFSTQVGDTIWDNTTSGEN